jgi:osmotically-inducible protein OsmY
MTAGTFDFPLATTQDQRIHDDVRRQITWSDIQSKEIYVAVRNATVFLTGTVLTCLEKREAEKAAMAPYGVRRVVNQLKVDPRCHRCDDEIAADIRAALLLAVSAWDRELLCEVHDGAVTLRGIVYWGFERQRAEDMTLGVLGVCSVTNLIELQAAPRDRLPSVVAPLRRPRRPLETKLEAVS